ncbi:hypothetical protein MJO28_011810 [Puccinia striiformis f. sp. tritici]|uniref:Uncharacterized protein n=1 Tax=Puccinia striiformis f. sp. tritici TaxID=168172 RepID=A0ACC0E3N4_9BASI|nr:hypothetical protein MJO28_011810 [Puccinia striiformis f. sp. tritici]
MIIHRPEVDIENIFHPPLDQYLLTTAPPPLNGCSLRHCALQLKMEQSQSYLHIDWRDADEQSSNRSGKKSQTIYDIVEHTVHQFIIKDDWLPLLKLLYTDAAQARQAEQPVVIAKVGHSPYCHAAWPVCSAGLTGVHPTSTSPVILHGSDVDACARDLLLTSNRTTTWLNLHNNKNTGPWWFTDVLTAAQPCVYLTHTFIGVSRLADSACNKDRLESINLTFHLRQLYRLKSQISTSRASIVLSYRAPLTLTGTVPVSAVSLSRAIGAVSLRFGRVNHRPTHQLHSSAQCFGVSLCLRLLYVALAIAVLTFLAFHDTPARGQIVISSDSETQLRPAAVFIQTQTPFNLEGTPAGFIN